MNGDARVDDGQKAPAGRLLVARPQPVLSDQPRGSAGVLELLRHLGVQSHPPGPGDFEVEGLAHQRMPEGQLARRRLADGSVVEKVIWIGLDARNLHG